MPRTKERRKITHYASTQEILTCLTYIPQYSVLLADHITSKPYSDFLKWLIENEFFKDQEDKIMIKKIAAEFKSDAARVTKWIRKIYDDIFELNDEKPELFQKSGTKVCIYARNYNDSCMFYTSLQVVPREFEKVSFPFISAKVGIVFFWVKKVEHQITSESTVTIWLKGGFVNKYRELALDKALFQKWIHFMDVYEKNEFELDDEIRKIYRD